MSFYSVVPNLIPLGAIVMNCNWVYYLKIIWNVITKDYNTTAHISLCYSRSQLTGYENKTACFITKSRRTPLGFWQKISPEFLEYKSICKTSARILKTADLKAWLSQLSRIQEKFCMPVKEELKCVYYLNHFYLSSSSVDTYIPWWVNISLFYEIRTQKVNPKLEEF